MGSLKFITLQQMHDGRPISKAKLTLKFASCPSVATTEGLNLLCHALAQQVAKRSIMQSLCHPQRARKGKDKIWPWEVRNPLLHFLSPQALLPYSAMCPLRVILGRDLLTFECPIKRRRRVRAPARVPFRRIADEQAAAVSECRTLAPSSHPLVLFHAYFPRLFCLIFFNFFFLHKHTSLGGKRSPASLIAAYLWSRRL